MTCFPNWLWNLSKHLPSSLPHVHTPSGLQAQAHRCDCHHLAFIHIGMLFSMAFLMFTNMFGSQSVQDDFTCKALVYMNRLMRGLSICTTCLLSVLQAITINSSSSWLAKFKFTSPCAIFHFFLFLWFLNMSVSINVVIYTVFFQHVWAHLMFISEYCSLYPMSYIIRNLFFILSLFREVTFVGVVMLISSAYMVILLYRHKRRSQHLHSTRFSPRHSPEKQATQTILLLMSLFVVVYWVDLIISSFSGLLWKYHPVTLGIQMIVVTVYASDSPLVLIRPDKRIMRVLQNISINNK